MQGMPQDDPARARLFMEVSIKDNIEQMNSTVERCFKDCVLSFHTKSLSDKEDLCVIRCLDKQAQFSQVASYAYAQEQSKFQADEAPHER
eukprot:CAMPEP_0205825198 /NCGR_PEP_ID=MMETSP0206-20130828/24296_1 /ASSEMBLY_ACC=CAM_ASM_000279 /TAXON_ID=36767 /ORGANISM="Euplotes focardii, Strain TN1" /LENGTH=89 /DNA_ID=CAMNT_0053124039 /DNA_START=45 /DNA_END=312 /DNA_ORIENTATION=+